jgi:hypothetical protein
MCPIRCLHAGSSGSTAGSSPTSEVDTSSGCWAQKELSIPKAATSSVSSNWTLTTSVLRSAHSGWSGGAAQTLEHGSGALPAARSPSPRTSEASGTQTSGGHPTRCGQNPHGAARQYGLNRPDEPPRKAVQPSASQNSHWLA